MREVERIMLNINVHVQKRIEIVWAEQGLSSIFVLKLWTATSLNQIHTSNEFKIQVSHRLVKRYYGNYKTSGERNLHRLMSNFKKALKKFMFELWISCCWCQNCEQLQTHTNHVNIWCQNSQRRNTAWIVTCLTPSIVWRSVHTPHMNRKVDMSSDLTRCRCSAQISLDTMSGMEIVALIDNSTCFNINNIYILVFH